MVISKRATAKEKIWVSFNGATITDDYAFTYKFNASPKDYVRREQYDEVLRHIVSLGGIIRFVYYELDTNSHFHIHGCAQFTGTPSYRDLTIKGYTSRWFRAWDVAGWEKYCRKDIPNDDMLDDEKEPNVTLNGNISNLKVNQSANPSQK